MKKRNTKGMEPQVAAVYDWLTRHDYITSLEAIHELGITRLSAAIHTLRHRHLIPVYCANVTVKTRYGTHTTIAVYSLLQDAIKCLEKKKAEEKAAKQKENQGGMKK